MPSVASVKKDLEALGTTAQEEILNHKKMCRDSRD